MAVAAWTIVLKHSGLWDRRHWRSMASPQISALLPWGEIPGWLRGARVLFFIAAALCGTVFIGAFVLQAWTLSSPEVAQGPFRHPEQIKGLTRYLTDQVDPVYRVMNILIPAVWGVAMALGVFITLFEKRIRAAQWLAHMDEISDRMDA
jgi:hypothetical protein